MGEMGHSTPLASSTCESHQGLYPTLLAACQPRSCCPATHQVEFLLLQYVDQLEGADLSQSPIEVVLGADVEAQRAQRDAAALQVR